MQQKQTLLSSDWNFYLDIYFIFFMLCQWLYCQRLEFINIRYILYGESSRIIYISFRNMMFIPWISQGTWNHAPKFNCNCWQLEGISLFWTEWMKLANLQIKVSYAEKWIHFVCMCMFVYCNICPMHNILLWLSRPAFILQKIFAILVYRALV